jgi:hypothetical protein
LTRPPDERYEHGSAARTRTHREKIEGGWAMSVIRVGSTSKYADGWAAVFGKAAKPAAGKKSKAVKKAAKKSKKSAKRR